MTETQTIDIESALTEVRAGFAQIKDLPATIKTLQDDSATAREQLTDLRRLVAARTAAPAARLRAQGEVSEDLARNLASHFIIHCERSGKLEALCSVSAQRDGLLNAARQCLGITVRTALTTTDIPLPIQYGSDLRELISDFGVARRHMTHYPIGMGVARPARMGTRPAFGAIAMSAAFTELSPTIEFASLESHKIGGMIRLPREIDEQSIVPLGRFLASFGAIEFARAEDKFAFLADGTGPYESIKGIVRVGADAGTNITLAAGKTKPSDVILDDLRLLRTKVNKAALSGRLSAYYFDSTWEVRLPALKTQADPNLYIRRPDGSATLDGYPIVWTDVLEPYGTSAAPSKCVAVFGALQFWWLGEHGTPRLDTSAHIWFANDQLAVRFIEEIDFDYCAPDATAALLTASA